ncbi:MAG: hypothetical protein IPP77_08680 [Bacteroidetes bacterium]|nr:hypothetical protein [Bacteroidota bacterium]
MKNVYLIFIMVLTIGVRAQTKAPEAKKATPAATNAAVGHEGHDHDGHSHDALMKQVGGDEKKVAPANPNAPRIIFKEDGFEFGELPEGRRLLMSLSLQIRVRNLCF